LLQPGWRLLASDGRDQTVRFWDTQPTNKLLCPLIVLACCHRRGLQPDGKTLVSAGLLCIKLIFWMCSNESKLASPFRCFHPLPTVWFSAPMLHSGRGSESSNILMDAARTSN
jgi:hypothetical protein